MGCPHGGCGGDGKGQSRQHGDLKHLIDGGRPYSEDGEGFASYEGVRGPPIYMTYTMWDIPV